MKTLVQIIILLILPNIFAIGQYNCQYEQTATEFEKYTFAKHTKLPSIRTTSFVPIAFHIIGRTDGSGLIPKPRIIELLCSLNETFAGHDIVFYLENYYIENILDDELYESSMPNAFLDYKIEGAINIFINKSEPGIGVTLGYYIPSTDIIVLHKNTFNVDLNPNNSVCHHELGHFFNLPHTFTIANAFEEPCPVDDNGFNEYVTRVDSIKNCDTAGDGFCDTPASIGSLIYEPPCEVSFSDASCDPFFEQYQPDLLNFMGINIFFDCSFHFSEQQFEHMSQNLMNRVSGGIVELGSPNAMIITEEPQIINLQTENSTVFVSWNNIFGATNYFVEISRTPNLGNISYQIIETNNNFTTFTGLVPNKQYYIRITPTNIMGGCVNSDMGGTPIGFATAVNVISEKPFDWNINVNNQQIFINMNFRTQTIANINIYNSMAQLLKSSTKTYSPNNSIESINMTDTAAGVYFISLTVDNKTYTKKFVIQ